MGSVLETQDGLRIDDQRIAEPSRIERTVAENPIFLGDRHVGRSEQRYLLGFAVADRRLPVDRIEVQVGNLLRRGTAGHRGR